MAGMTRTAALARTFARLAHTVTPTEEARAWRATLQMASPEERRGIARQAWIDLRAYGYTQEGERP